MIADTWYKYWVRVLYYGISAKLTYRIPVPRTRNEPKSATVARARVPPYFLRRYGGRRVPPRRGGSSHTKYRIYTNSTRRAYLRGRSAQSLRNTGSRSRNCACTVQFRTRTVQFRTCTARSRTILEFRDREQVRRHVRVTRGVPYRRMRTPLSPRRRRRGGTRRPPYLRRKYGGTRARANVADFGSFQVRGTGTRYVAASGMPYLFGPTEKFLYRTCTR